MEHHPSTARDDEDAGARRRTILTVALLLAFPISLWALGAFDYLRDVETLRAHVATLGIAAPIVWVLGQSIAEGLGVPSTLVVVAAMVLWPAPSALLICIVGSTGGCIVGFWLARALARDWVLERLPPSVLRFEEWVGRHGFFAAFALRLVLFVAPGPAWVMGLSSARFLPCMAGAALGCVPGLYLIVYHGPELLDEAQRAPSWVMNVAAAALVFGLMVLAVLRRRRANA